MLAKAGSFHSLRYLIDVKYVSFVQQASLFYANGPNVGIYRPGPPR